MLIVAIACYLFMLNAIVVHRSIDYDDHGIVLMVIILFLVAIMCRFQVSFLVAVVHIVDEL